MLITPQKYKYNKTKIKGLAKRVEMINEIMHRSAILLSKDHRFWVFGYLKGFNVLNERKRESMKRFGGVGGSGDLRV